MEPNAQSRPNKGGRPKKENKKAKVLSLKCTRDEHQFILDKVAVSGLSVSEYLVKSALNAIVENSNKALPNEVLKMIGTLNHIAANLNQITKKLNSSIPLEIMDKLNIRILPRELLRLIADIKKYLR